MSDLLDNIGKGFQNSNALYDRKIVKIYVENEDDVPFWKHIFNQFNIPTSITPSAYEPTKSNLNRGKTNVLNFSDQTNNYFLLCVDSDYDYLFDGATVLSQSIKENPYIFQTYTYSIENYKCFAQSLHQVVLDATLNDNDIFDFVGFMEKYSEIVYELFIYSFFYEKQNQIENQSHQTEYQNKKQILNEDDLKKWQSDNLPQHKFPIKDFCNTIRVETKIKIQNEDEIELNSIERKISNKIDSLEKIDDTLLESVKNELRLLGLNSNNTYLFVQGHTIYDNVVKMFINQVADYLKKEKIKEFKELAKHNEDAERKRNEYIKMTTKDSEDRMTNTEKILFTHKNYENCFLMQKIKQDIEKYLNFVK